MRLFLFTNYVFYRGSVIHAVFTQMFVCILDPLHRESFTIDELVLTLQLLFFTIGGYKEYSAGTGKLSAHKIFNY